LPVGAADDDATVGFAAGADPLADVPPLLEHPAAARPTAMASAVMGTRREVFTFMDVQLLGRGGTSSFFCADLSFDARPTPASRSCRFGATYHRNALIDFDRDAPQRQRQRPRVIKL